MCITWIGTAATHSCSYSNPQMTATPTISLWLHRILTLPSSLSSFSADLASTRTFLLRHCQQSAAFGGGFSKTPDCPPDILHTYYSLCWLSLLQNEHERIPMVEGEEVTETGILPTCIDVHPIALGQSNSSVLTALSVKDRAKTCLVSSPLPVSVTVMSSQKSNFNLGSIDPRLSLCSTRCPPCFAEWEIIERKN
jgi:prenyltransferase beta subunit